MNKRIKYLLTFLFISIFLTACGSASIKKTEHKSGVISITVDHSSSPGPYRSTRLLVIKNDLSTYFTGKNEISNEITKENNGKITQAQFDDLVKPLEKINLAKLKSSRRPEPLLGGSNSSITIKTDKGEYSFQDGSYNIFPTIISELAGKIRKL